MCLRKIGKKGLKAPKSSRITMKKFQEFFERASKKKNEEDPSVKAGVNESLC